MNRLPTTMTDEVPTLFETLAELAQEAVRVEPPYRGKVELLHYESFTLIKSEIDGKIRRDWFIDETPVWLFCFASTDHRRDLLAGLYRAGCGVTESAELMRVPCSVVSSDLEHLRAYRPGALESPIKPVDPDGEAFILQDEVPHSVGHQSDFTSR